MQIFSIACEDQYIIYRPLRRLAFIGNRAMRDLALAAAGAPAGCPPSGAEQALAYLDSIGFNLPDPPPPVDSALTAAFRPTSAALLLTGRCNLRCVYCYAAGGEKSALDMPALYARAAIEQACRNALEQGRPDFEVTFHGGGEPSLAWQTLTEAAQFARGRELPAKLNMVSNGIWNRSRRDWVIHNLDGLTLSMDGGQLTQDAQRPFPNGRGSFKALMQTIHALDRAAFAYNLRVTCTPENFKRLPLDITFLCNETGCRLIQVEPAFQTRRGVHIAPDADQSLDFAEAFLAAYDKAAAAGRFIYYSGARPWLLDSVFCSAPFGSTLTVNPLGQVVACYEITDENHPQAGLSTFGRLDENGSLSVDETRRRTFLQSLSSRRAACRDCFCYYHCAGDCYTRAFEAAANDPAGLPYARCLSNRAITTGLLLRYMAAGGGLYAGLPCRNDEKIKIQG